jgi:hypothetical protein
MMTNAMAWLTIAAAFVSSLGLLFVVNRLLR